LTDSVAEEYPKEEFTMITDSFFSMMCAGLIGVLFGLVLCFAGYRLFVVLLPLWGFIFGLALGVQTIQILFSTGFLATVTSWVVGIVVGVIFAALSYLFYIAAVAILAGSLGYALSVALMLLIGMDMGFLMWIIGIVVAIAFAVVTIRFNLQKWVVIAATSILGAGLMIETVAFMFFPAAALLANPVKLILDNSPLAVIVFIIFAILGIVAQVQSTRNFKVADYNKWGEVNSMS
jgi:hypothetical protein